MRRRDCLLDQSRCLACANRRACCSRRCRGLPAAPPSSCRPTWRHRSRNCRCGCPPRRRTSRMSRRQRWVRWRCNLRRRCRCLVRFRQVRSSARVRSGRWKRRRIVSERDVRQHGGAVGVGATKPLSSPTPRSTMFPATPKSALVSSPPSPKTRSFPPLPLS